MNFVIDPQNRVQKRRNSNPYLKTVNDKINQILKHLIDQAATDIDVITRSLKFIQRLNDDLRKKEEANMQEPKTQV